MTQSLKERLAETDPEALARIEVLEGALRDAARRFDDIYETATVGNNAYQNEATIHGINSMADVAQSDARSALNEGG